MQALDEAAVQRPGPNHHVERRGFRPETEIEAAPVRCLVNGIHGGSVVQFAEQVERFQQGFRHVHHRVHQDAGEVVAVHAHVRLRRRHGEAAAEEVFAQGPEPAAQQVGPEFAQELGVAELTGSEVGHGLIEVGRLRVEDRAVAGLVPRPGGGTGDAAGEGQQGGVHLAKVPGDGEDTGLGGALEAHDEPTDEGFFGGDQAIPPVIGSFGREAAGPSARSARAGFVVGRRGWVRASGWGWFC